MAAGMLPPLIAQLDMNLSGFQVGMGQALKGFAQLGESGESVFAGLASAGGVAAAAIGAAAVAIGASAVKLASSYGAEMTKVQALTGASAEEMVVLDRQVKQLAVSTGIGPVELAKGLYFVKSAGFDAATSTQILEYSAKAAASGLGDFHTVADGVSSVMAAYSKEGMTASHATDVFTQTVVEGKVQADTLVPAMGRILGVSAELGISFEQASANMAVLTRTGMSAANASTSLGATESQLLKLATPTKNQEKAMHDMGISYNDVKQHLAGPGGLIGTLQWLTDKAGNNKEAMVGLFSNVRALRDVLGSSGAQGEQYAKIFDDISHAQDGAGATSKAFEITQKSFKQQLAELKAQIDVWLIQLGDKLIPLLRRGAEMVNQLVGWLKEHKEVAIALAAVIGGALVVAIGAFVVSMIAAAAPVLAIGAAIGALVYGVIYAYQHFGWFRDAVDATVTVIEKVVGWVKHLIEVFREGGLSGVLEFLKAQFAEWGKALWQWIKDAVPAVLRELGSLLGKLGEWIVGTALPSIATHLLNWGVAFAAWVPGAALDLLFGLAHLLGQMIDWVLFDAAPQLFNNLLHWSVQFQNWVGDAVVKLVGKLPEIASALITFVEGLPQKIYDGLGDLGELLIDKGGQIVAGIVSGIKRHGGDIASALSSLVPGGGLAKQAFDAIGGLGFADGGFVPGPIGSPQLAVVHGGERVLTPGEQARGMGGSQGGGDVNLTYNNYASDVSAAGIATELIWQMRTQRMVA